jgi:hypothetical protein
MSADIFEEAKRRLDLAHDASDMRPEMPRVFVAELFSGDAKGLAGIAAMDDIHDATPRFIALRTRTRSSRERAQAILVVRKCGMILAG